MSGYFSLIGSSSVNLSVLRAFRVLRPLRTISSVEGLRVLVTALISALPLLRDTIIVLIFFFLIFAIAGLQLWSGMLKNRCVSITTGQEHPDGDLCGSRKCGEGYFCGKRIGNPNHGVTNFDNILYALLAVFQSVTLEGWSVMMVMLQKTFSDLAVLFFFPLVFIGAFFLLNLTLAVINSKFNEAHKKHVEDESLRRRYEEDD